MSNQKLTDEQVLVLLSLEPGLTIKQIAVKLLVSESAACNRVDELELSGKLVPLGRDGWRRRWAVVSSAMNTGAMVIA